MSTTHTDVAGDPAPRFHVTGPVDAVLTLTASGHLDEKAAERLAAAADTVRRRMIDGTERVVLDLTSVSFLALEALGPLLSLARTCRTTGLDLRVHASPAARRKIALTGLTQALLDER